MLKDPKKFEWTETYEHAFQELKRHLGSPPFLSKPKEGEKLYFYLAISQYMTSAALIRDYSDQSTTQANGCFVLRPVPLKWKSLH